MKMGENGECNQTFYDFGSNKTRLRATEIHELRRLNQENIVTTNSHHTNSYQLKQLDKR